MEEFQKFSYSKCDISYMEPAELGTYLSFEALFPALLGPF
jgi:hypothetical protein